MNYKFPSKATDNYSNIDYELSRNIDRFNERNNELDEVELPKERSSKYYDYYVVIKGDNLTKISRKLNLSLSDVVLANPQLSLMRNSIDLIYPDERIYYPIK